MPLTSHQYRHLILSHLITAIIFSYSRRLGPYPAYPNQLNSFRLLLDAEKPSGTRYPTQDLLKEGSEGVKRGGGGGGGR
jgi:hypothetical protein